MERITTLENVRAAAQAVREAKPDFKPQVGIVCGSGLGGLADVIEDATCIDYADVPHMVVSTAPSHKGRFVCGDLAGKQVMCMQGRLHAYEGYTADEISFPIYIMRELGIEVLIVTNAAGGIVKEWEVGDLMLITDHINLLGMDPCIGPDDQELRHRFFDMTDAYDPGLRGLAQDAAAELGIELHEGVYVAEPGPSFETPAEICAYRTMGGDAIGMSTVLETIAARSADVKVLGISLISNPAAGVYDEPLEICDIYRAAAVAAEHLQGIVTKVVGSL